MYTYKLNNDRHFIDELRLNHLKAITSIKIIFDYVHKNLYKANKSIFLKFIKIELLKKLMSKD